MHRYTVSSRIEENTELYELNDHETRRSATVAPAIGAQCIRFRWNRGERVIELLYPPGDLAALRETPVLFGNPILFPFPNRIKGGEFEFGGERVRLPTNDGLGNAIHGLTLRRPWRVVDTGADPRRGAWITCRFNLSDHPDLASIYPFPFQIEYTYRLRLGRLENEIRVENAGDRPMPAGLGLHPWFPMPLTEVGARGRCRIQAPVSRFWELDHAYIPTGRFLEQAHAQAPVNGAYVGEDTIHDVYTDLNAGLAGRGFSKSVYADPGSGIEIAVLADTSFRELVVYAPTELPAICLEPYTCTIDAFNLSARGIDSGAMVLQPGERWAGCVVYEASDASGAH